MFGKAKEQSSLTGSHCRLTYAPPQVEPFRLPTTIPLDPSRRKAASALYRRCRRSQNRVLGKPYGRGHPNKQACDGRVVCGASRIRKRRSLRERHRVGDRLSASRHPHPPPPLAYAPAGNAPLPPSTGPTRYEMDLNAMPKHEE